MLIFLAIRMVVTKARTFRIVSHNDTYRLSAYLRDR